MSLSHRGASRPPGLRRSIFSHALGAIRLALILALGHAPPAPAQATDPALMDSSATPAPTHRLQRVVVTATGKETPLDEVASSVTVITEEEIERKQQRLVTDVLREVPGVDVRQSGGPGTQTSIFIRGMDSDQVLVLLDGVELNDPSSPSRAPLLDHLTTEGVERIEVLRGPQSGLYGAGAMGGVIQIVTKRGQEGFSAAGRAEGGAYASVRGAGSVSGGIEHLDYAASFSHWTSDGFSARSFPGIERDPYRNTMLSARAGWRPVEAFSVDAMIRYTDAKVAFDSFGVEEDQYTNSDQILAKIEPRLQLLEGRWEQSLAFRYTDNERDTVGTYPSDVEGRLYAVEWRNDLHLLSGHRTTLGFEHDWEEAGFDAFDDSRRTFALYVQDQFTWGERVFGTLGLRFDDPSDYDSRVTYRAAAGLNVPELHSILRASFGTGFKAPSLSELNPLAWGGNPNLRPEKSMGFDVGIEHEIWKGRIAVGATFFYNDIDDLIVALLVDPDTYTSVNFNVDEAETYGVEVALRAELLENLGLSASYTYTHSEAKGAPATWGLEPGSRLLRRPDHKASVDVVWSFLDERGGFTCSLLYVGDRRDIDPVTFAAAEADDYTVVRVAVRFAATRWLEVYGRVDNLFDADYEDVLGYATAGISAYGGIVLRY